MNESLLKSDIFFVISALGFVVIAVLIVWAFIYILQILRTIKEISKSAKEGADSIVESINETKNTIHRDGILPLLTSIFTKLYKKNKK